MRVLNSIDLLEQLKTNNPFDSIKIFLKERFFPNNIDQLLFFARYDTELMYMLTIFSYIPFDIGANPTTLWMTFNITCAIIIMLINVTLTLDVGLFLFSKFFGWQWTRNMYTPESYLWRVIFHILFDSFILRYTWLVLNHGVYTWVFLIAYLSNLQISYTRMTIILSCVYFFNIIIIF